MREVEDHQQPQLGGRALRGGGGGEQPPRLGRGEQRCNCLDRYRVVPPWWEEKGSSFIQRRGGVVQPVYWGARPVIFIIFSIAAILTLCIAPALPHLQHPGQQQLWPRPPHLQRPTHRPCPPHLQHPAHNPHTIPTCSILGSSRREALPSSATAPLSSSIAAAPHPPRRCQEPFRCSRVPSPPLHQGEVDARARRSNCS